jgi:transposase
MAKPKKAKLGYRVPDELWTRLEPLIPRRINRHPLGGGRPARSNRDCADAIFFVLRTGCQWEALNATGLCPHSTAHDRFQEWVETGVWQKLWAVLLQEYDGLHGLDWSYLSVDGSMTKAPLATLGEKKRPQSDRPRQARGQTQRGDGGDGTAGRGGGGRSQP